MKIDGKEVLILHVKKKWWDMIKSGEKPEEYRRLTDYWFKRLVEIVPYVIEAKYKKGNIMLQTTGKTAAYKKFDEVWLLCGYPKLTEVDKIIKWINPTIEIREGFPEWGAPENESVFVIKGICEKSV